jgi:hypothetical protein
LYVFLHSLSANPSPNALLVHWLNELEHWLIHFVFLFSTLISSIVTTAGGGLGILAQPISNTNVKIR